MSTYNTGNPVPSIDPRDLDDNAKVLDRLLNSSSDTEPDRLGVARTTWTKMEQDATALVSPNVSALAGLTGAADRVMYFTGAGALSLATLTAFSRTLLDDADAAAARTTLGAQAAAAPLTALAALTPAANTFPYWTSTTAAANATLNAGMRAMLALTAAADRLPYLTSDSAAALATFTAFARTLLDDADAATARTTLGVLAQSDKPAWTAYTPTVTAGGGTFTAAAATGKYQVLFGICYFQVTVTVTTKGTGSYPIISLPVGALSGSSQMPIPCRESAKNGKSGSAVIAAGLLTAQLSDYANGDLVTADGSIIYVNGSYPVA